MMENGNLEMNLIANIHCTCCYFIKHFSVIVDGDLFSLNHCCSFSFRKKKMADKILPQRVSLQNCE